MATTRLTEAFIASLPLPHPGKNRIYYDSEVRGFSVRITATGFRGFLLCYARDGYERRMPIGEWVKGAGMLSPARERAAMLRLEVQSGGDPARDKQLASEARAKERLLSAKEVSFEHVAQRYLAEHAAKKKSGFADARRIHKYLLPVWSGRKMKDITRKEVHDMIAPIAAAGLHGEARLRLALVRKMFSFAVDELILDLHPCLRMKSPGGPPVARDRVLTSDKELRIFWRITDGGIWRKLVPDSERFALRFMLLTGCRPTEAAELKWNEIDFDQALWNLPAARSKNKRAHVIPLLPEALLLVKSQLGQSSGEYVFPAPRSPHITQNRLALALRSMSRKLKRIGFEPFTPHDLRRTVETGMAKAKVSKEYRDRVLNHVDNSIGGRHYNKHDYFEEKQTALRKWCESLFMTLEPAQDNVVPIRQSA